MTAAAAIARRLLSRTVLVVILVLALLGALASLVYGALAQTGVQLASSVRLTVAAPLELRPDLPLPGHAEAQFTTVDVYVTPDENVALPFQYWAALLPFVVAGLTCVLIIALALQLLRGRPFGLGSGIAMLVVGAVAIGSGVAVPALHAAAERAIVAALDLPTTGDEASTWVAPAPWLWEYSDWPIIILGLLTLLGGWLVLRARQLRLDLEGTI